MKKTTKLLALMLCIALALSVAACGTTDAPATTPAASDPTPAPATEGTDTDATENDAPAQTFTIGISQLVQHVALDAATQGFRDAIVAELGEANVTFIEQNAQGDPATCSSIANSLVASNVDLILANATPALQAAAAATGDIPVLGTSITEYGVALDIKDFDGVVGGNVSGTSDLAPLTEQAEMIRELFPEATNKVGLIYCSAEANSLYQVTTVADALNEAGVTTAFFPFSDSNDLAAVATSAAADCELIYIPTDNTVASNMGIIDNICRPAGVPIVAGEEGICSGGGVATLSIDYYDLGYATGLMAVRILRDGADVSTMAIEYAPNFTKKYNPEVAAELGVEIPDGYEAIVVE